MEASDETHNGSQSGQKLLLFAGKLKADALRSHFYKAIHNATLHH